MFLALGLVASSLLWLAPSRPPGGRAVSAAPRPAGAEDPADRHALLPPGAVELAAEHLSRAFHAGGGGKAPSLSALAEQAIPPSDADRREAEAARSRQEARARQLRGGPPTAPRLAAECTSPHFSFDEDVMPAKFRRDMVAKAKKIGRDWVHRGWGKRYGKVDIGTCKADTPECVFYLCLSEVGDHTQARAFRKCCVEHARLRDTAFDVIALLERHNVTYFLSTGTALGAVRHHGTIIPWDTDVDLAIRPDDEKAVATLCEAELGAQHHFHRDRLGKGMLWVHHSKDGKPADGPHIEIFFEAHYTDPEAFPVERCAFYGRQVNCPNRRMFGKWFPSGWQGYTGAHFHNPGRCTMYEDGRRVERAKC